MSMSLYCLVEAARVRENLPGPPQWPYQPLDNDYFRDVPLAFHGMQYEVLMVDFVEYKLDCFAYVNDTDQEHLNQQVLLHLESIERAINESFLSYSRDSALPVVVDAWDTVKHICVEQELAREKDDFQKRVQSLTNVVEYDDAHLSAGRK